MGLMGSGIGKTICRLLVNQADFAFHYGIPYPVSGTATNPVSRLMEHLNTIWRPTVREHPPSSAESRAAVSRTESILSYTFDLDPSYYPAYTTYFHFLTENPTKGGDDDWRGIDEYQKTLEGATAATPIGETAKRGRLLKALMITHRAIQSYQVGDPEQSVAAALAVYNQYFLLKPRDPSRNLAEAVEYAQRAADEMGILLENAEETVRQQQWNGTWQIRPLARREDYAATYQLANKIRESVLKTIPKEPLPKETE